MASNVARALRLMLVTDDRLVPAERLVEACRAAVRGGVTSVQLRLKRVEPRALVTLARELVAAVPVPVLINDRLDVAMAAGAAGVHLGPDDLPVALARRAAPPGFLIGASVGRVSELESGGGADYWGVGPWNVTTTKSNAGNPLGAEGFRAMVAQAGGIPCMAIGGVRPGDVAEVLGAGGAGVAVVSGILGRPDVEAAARAYHRSPRTC